MTTLDDILKTLQKDQPIIRRMYPSAEQEMSDTYLLQIFEKVGQSLEPRYRIDGDNKAVVLNMFRWLIGDEHFKASNPVTHKSVQGRLNKGIYLCGQTGTGKTLSMNILKRIIYAFGLKYELNRQQTSLYWKTYRADVLADRYAHGDSLQDVIDLPVLGIDDLGTENTDIVYMGNHMNLMKNIIEQRGDRKDRLTFFTSNLAIGSQELTDKYGERAVSRLTDMCNFYFLKGKDHRMP